MKHDARELSVDAVMDVARDILWPDETREEPSVEVDDVDEIRAQEYSLLAMLLSRAPDAGRAQSHQPASR